DPLVVPVLPALPLLLRPDPLLAAPAPLDELPLGMLELPPSSAVNDPLPPLSLLEQAANGKNPTMVNARTDEGVRKGPPVVREARQRVGLCA
ncbi:MAG: hypothetical protein JOZ69_13785, partial [Myxococcales bacterium]|nr:hypothetical protein [Myxococcales bacterium]